MTDDDLKSGGLISGFASKAIDPLIRAVTLVFAVAAALLLAAGIHGIRRGTPGCRPTPLLTHVTGPARPTPATR